LFTPCLAVYLLFEGRVDGILEEALSEETKELLRDQRGDQ